jgi:hypothetical protein
MMPCSLLYQEGPRSVYRYQHMHMESTNTNKMQNPEIMHWLNWANSKLSELRGANAKQRP